MKTPCLCLALASFLAGIALTGLGIGRAADAPATSGDKADKDNTLVYRAETPDKTWDGWGSAAPPDTTPGTKPEVIPEVFHIVENAPSPRTFSGKVVVDGPLDGVEVGIVSLVGIHWNLPDAYQWEPVGPDGTFSILDKNYPNAAKALVVRGPNTTWTFLRYNFTPQQAGTDIVLKAGPSRKIRLTASGSDMVNLTQVGYEPFTAHTAYDDLGHDLRRQRFDYDKSGDQDHFDLELPIGEIAIFVHRAGYADFYQIVDTTKASHIHFVLRKAGRMKITVLDADGKPKEGVALGWMNPAAPLSIWQTKTGPTGIVFPDHLVPGTFSLNVQGFPGRKVEVKEGQVTELTYQDGTPPAAPVFSPSP